MRTRGNAAIALLALAVGAPVLSGCSTGDAKTSCDLDACTVTYARGVEASTNVLGVEVAFVSVTGDQVTLRVAGQEVSGSVSPDAQLAEVAGLTVKVSSVTDSEVVLKISR